MLTTAIACLILNKYYLQLRISQQIVALFICINVHRSHHQRVMTKPMHVSVLLHFKHTLNKLPLMFFDSGII